MILEEALTAALVGETTISAHLGDRVFPVGGSQGETETYLSYQRIATPTAKHLAGPSTLDWPRFQFSFWASSALAARSAAEAVRVFLESGEKNVGGFVFEASFQDERATFDEVTRRHGVTQDYFIFHER